MSYTEHPDNDAARWMQEEERKALELEWLIEEEGKKECYNPFLIENIVEALHKLDDESVTRLEWVLKQAITSPVDLNKDMCLTFVDNLTYYSELYQEKRIRENVMKGK